MTERATPDRFLREAAWLFPRQPMAGDASDRRYFRLSRPDGTTAVLMQAGPAAAAQTKAFAEVDIWLRGQGFSAPEILHAQPEHGLLLLEDFGSDTYPEVLARDPALTGTLYSAAILFLNDLHQRPPPAKTFPFQDADYFTSQTRLLTEHCLPGLPTSQTDRLEALLRYGFARLTQACSVLVLRDFHAGNLVWLPGRSGSAAVGVLDFQDAVIGHPAYDLASLLQDSRRRTTPEFEQIMLKTYWPGGVPDWFLHDYALMGAQRLMRILGIFARLAAQGKPQYQRFIPETLRLLWRNLDSGHLPGLREWALENLGAPQGQP